MAITYPTSPDFKAVNLKTDDPTIAAKAANNKRYVRKVGGHMWKFTLSYPPLNESQMKPIMAAILKARGIYETFTVIPPNLADPLGSQKTNTNISSPASIGATSVSISGAGANSTFKAGDIIKFVNHSKVYMLTSDATANGSGYATLAFMPPLMNALTVGSSNVQHSNIPFNVSLVNNVQEISTDVFGLNTYELDVEEVLP